jgi:hypothetical protein
MQLLRSHGAQTVALRHFLRWVVAALAGYLIVAVFFIALLAFEGWWTPSLSSTALSRREMLIFAGVAAAPLAIAFLWYRIQRVKVYEFDIYLNRATRQPSVLLSDLKAVEFMPAGASYEPVMTENIAKAIREEGLELLLVDLEKGPRWWSTRLFLLAALAEEYTTVQQLIFATSNAFEQSSFIGMASPKSVRLAYATKHRFIEKAYAQYDKWQVRGKIPTEEEVGHLIGQFGYWFNEQNIDEHKIKEIVTPNGLRNELRDDLVTAGVQWPQHPLVTHLLTYRIIDRLEPYVVLLDDRQLLRVVDRRAVATQVCRTALEHELK